MKINEHALKYIFDDTLYKRNRQSAKEINDKVKYIGENQKNILIVVPKQEKILSEDEKIFLEKILVSIGLSLNDCAVVCPNAESNFAFYKRSLNCSNIITFGVRPFEIGIEEIEVPLYEVKEYKHTSLLHSDELLKVKANVDKKKALWINLKKMFQ